MVDTSVLLAVVLDEPERPVIIKATRGASLIGPPTIPHEVGNALSAMLRRRRLVLAEAMRVYKAFSMIPIRYVEVDIERSLALAS